MEYLWGGQRSVFEPLTSCWLAGIKARWPRVDQWTLKFRNAHKEVRATQWLKWNQYWTLHLTNKPLFRLNNRQQQETILYLYVMSPSLKEIKLVCMTASLCSFRLNYIGVQNCCTVRAKSILNLETVVTVFSFHWNSRCCLNEGSVFSFCSMAGVKAPAMLQLNQTLAHLHPRCNSSGKARTP